MFSTLVAHLAEAQEIERRQLARALHDEVGQNVTAIGFTLDFIHSQLGESNPPIEIVRTYLSETLNLVEQTTDRIRQIVTELRPPMLDEYGLIEALDWYAGHLAQETGLEITVQPAYFAPRLPAAVESVVFRIAQEALNNVIDHAQATRVLLTVEAEASAIRLTITDNGLGFDVEHQTSSPASFGLLTMAERAKSINGRCSIESHLNRGTRVMIEIPR
ncbi:MAG: sensor histidine kinase [Anaerolineae bacterium]|nr:sensor histidine kinase [Anaerolineae bacterium]